MRRTGNTSSLPTIGIDDEAISKGVLGERAAPAGRAQPARAPLAMAAELANRLRELDMACSPSWFECEPFLAGMPPTLRTHLRRTRTRLRWRDADHLAPPFQPAPLRHAGMRRTSRLRHPLEGARDVLAQPLRHEYFQIQVGIEGGSQQLIGGAVRPFGGG